MGDEDDGLWEKPAWAKGGHKLKSTGKAEQMKGAGNLAAPITFTPFKSNDHSNRVANPELLKASDVGAAAKEGYDLAAPITFTPYKSDDHTNKVANAEVLRKTDVGEAVKQGQNLAMPITNIRDEIRKAKQGN
jgi:hypothetical protein